MLTDYFELGSSPTDEDCAQVGTPEYLERMRIETRQLIRMLEEHHPVPDGLRGRYAVKGFPHDFGTYHEVCAVFDPDSPTAYDWAMAAEDRVPRRWDAAALAALAAAGFAPAIFNR